MRERNWDVLRETIDVLAEEGNVQMSAMLALVCADEMGIGRRRRRHRGRVRGPGRRSRGRERRVKGSRRAERGRTRRRVQAEGIEDGSENGARCRIEMKYLESETSPKGVRAGVR